MTAGWRTHPSSPACPPMVDGVSPLATMAQTWIQTVATDRQAGITKPATVDADHGGTLRVRPAYLTLGICWIGAGRADFAAVEYARTKARVSGRIGLRIRHSKWPATRRAHPTSVSPGAHHRNEAQFVDGRGRTGRREEISNGSGWVWDETAISSPTSMSFVGRNPLRSNWERVISQSHRRAFDPYKTSPSWLSASRLLPAGRAAELPPAGTTIFAFGSPLELKFSVSSGRAAWGAQREFEAGPPQCSKTSCRSMPNQPQQLHVDRHRHVGPSGRHEHRGGGPGHGPGGVCTFLSS